MQGRGRGRAEKGWGIPPSTKIPMTRFKKQLAQGPRENPVQAGPEFCWERLGNGWSEAQPAMDVEIGTLLASYLMSDRKD
jgi:hypothetical protein